MSNTTVKNPNGDKTTGKNSNIAELDERRNPALHSIPSGAENSQCISGIDPCPTDKDFLCPEDSPDVSPPAGVTPIYGREWANTTLRRKPGEYTSRQPRDVGANSDNVTPFSLARRSDARFSTPGRQRPAGKANPGGSTVNPNAYDPSNPLLTEADAISAVEQAIQLQNAAEKYRALQTRLCEYLQKLEQHGVLRKHTHSVVVHVHGSDEALVTFTEPGESDPVVIQYPAPTLNLECPLTGNAAQPME